MREIGRHPLPRWTRLPAGLRWLQRRIAPIQSHDARALQRRPPLRHRPATSTSCFLDADRQYSCAYFAQPGPTWRRRSSPRSGTSPPSSLSSRANACSTSAAAGAAWRSTSPSSCGADVTGVTLSDEQLDLARERVAADGPVRRRRLRASTTTATSTGRFDRIVSVGMFEHVGVDALSRLLRAAARLLSRRRRRPGPHHRPLRARPPPPTPSSPSTSSPAATSRRCRRCVPGDRALGLVDHRHRDPAPALRRDAAAPGASASWPTRRGRRPSTTSASAGCGSSISQAPRRLPLRRTRWSSRSSSPSVDAPAAHPRLHRGSRARLAALERARPSARMAGE